MSALPHASVFLPQGESDSFVHLRSAFIDEFARLEIAVEHCLDRLHLGTDARKVCFAQRLAKLSKAAPGPHLSKEKAKALASLVQTCEPLQHLRASIVHAAMEFGSRGNEPVVLFRNVADIASHEPIYHVLTVPDFETQIEALKALTIRVSNSLNPSSPPPPRPAAAAGP
jgi:hypothetical protein